MGIRSRQLNLPELYEALDARYGTVKINEITINIDSEEWIEESGYFVQTITDLEGFTSNTKLIVEVKLSEDATYEEILDKENLFAHIVKIVSDENSIKVYSSKKLDTSFDIQVMHF